MFECFVLDVKLIYDSSLLIRLIISKSNLVPNVSYFRAAA